MPYGTAPNTGISDIGSVLDSLLADKFGTDNVDTINDVVDQGIDYNDDVIGMVAIDASKGSMKSGMKKIRQEVVGRYDKLDQIPMMKEVERLYPIAEMANEFNRFGNMELFNRIPKEDVPTFLAMLDKITPEKDKDRRSTLEKLKSSFKDVGAPQMLGSFTKSLDKYVRPMIPKAVDEALELEESFRKMQDFGAAAELRGRGQKAIGNNLAEKGAILAAEMAPPILTSVGMGAAPGAGTAFWMSQIAPDVMEEMEARGVSEGIAKPLSLIAALPIALLEKVQMKGLGKGLLNSAESFAQKSIWGAAKNIALREGKELGVQIFQENAQELGQIAAVSLGRFLDDNADKFTKEDLTDVKNRLKETTISTALATPFLRAPGGVMQAGRDVAGVRPYALDQVAIDPKGASWFATNYPEQAKKIAESEPSRKTFQDVLGKDSKLNKDERLAFQQAIQNTLAEVGTTDADQARAELLAQNQEQMAERELRPSPMQREERRSNELQTESVKAMEGDQAELDRIAVELENEKKQDEDDAALDAEEQNDAAEALLDKQEESRQAEVDRGNLEADRERIGRGDFSESELTEDEKEMLLDVKPKYNQLSDSKQLADDNPFVFSWEMMRKKGKIAPSKKMGTEERDFFNKYKYLKADPEDVAKGTVTSADVMVAQIASSSNDAGSQVAKRLASEPGGDPFQILREIAESYNGYNNQMGDQKKEVALKEARGRALLEYRDKKAIGPIVARPEEGQALLAKAEKAKKAEKSKKKLAKKKAAKKKIAKKIEETVKPKEEVKAEPKVVEPTPEVKADEPVVAPEPEVNAAPEDLIGETDAFAKAKNLVSQINKTFKKTIGPKTKGKMAQNHALNEAKAVSKMIDDGKIDARAAAERLEKALADANEFAREKTLPPQKQEETLIDVAPEGELNIGSMQKGKEAPKPVEKKEDKKPVKKKAPSFDEDKARKQIDAMYKEALSTGDVIQEGKGKYKALNKFGESALKQIRELEKELNRMSKIDGYDEDTTTGAAPGSMSMIYEGEVETESPVGLNVGEMNLLLKESGADVPSIYAKLGDALGKFSGNKGIRLRADIFIGPVIKTGVAKNEDVDDVVELIVGDIMATFPNLTEDDISVKIKSDPDAPGKKRITVYRVDPTFAAKVLAHEIGHWVDYMPDENMGRGNILGRLATLSKFMRNTIDPLVLDTDVQLAKQLREQARKDAGKSPGKASPEYADWQKRVEDRFSELANESGLITRSQITKELKDLTMWWKPFDENRDPDYTKYRHSSVELYADALSVLLNKQNELRNRAPLFYETFFQLLERKPEVKAAYEQTVRDVVSGVSGDKMLNTVYEDFDRAEEEKRNALESRKRKRDIGTTLGTAFIDRFWWLYRVVAKAKKEGKTFADPRIIIDEAKYTGSQIDEYKNRNQEIAVDLEKAGVGEQDFGVYLMHQRHLNAKDEQGQRAIPVYGDLAGLEKADAAFRKIMGDEKIAAMEKARKKFRKVRKDLILSKVSKTHPFGKEFIDFLNDNEYYARNEVVDYIDNKTGVAGSGLKIFERVGSLKGINNPWMSTMASDISMMWALNWNHAKMSTAEFLKDNGESDNYQEAERKWNGKQMAPVESSDPNLKLVTYMDDGELKGFYSDRNLAKAFDKGADDSVREVASLLRLFSHPARLWFTTVRPGFQAYNALFRDPLRTIINTGVNPLELYVQLLKSFKPVIKDMVMHDEKTMREMRERGLLVHFGNLSEQDDDTRQLERILGEYKDEQTWKKMIANPFRSFWNTVLIVGSIGENVNKYAAYTVLKNNQEKLGLTDKKIDHEVRHWAGSPSFITGGSITPIVNNILLFSNAGIQGWRSDIEAFQNDKVGVGLRRIGYSIAPKMVLVAIATGAASAFLRSMGADDDDELLQWLEAQRKILARVSIYDIVNYHIIPLGLTLTEKAVYLRFPVDETSRILGGAFTKLFTGDNVLESIIDAAAYMGDQGPGWNPAFTLGKEAITYMTGGNPYDSFREKHAIPDSVREAGGIESHKAFGKWLWNRYGGSFIYKFNTDNPTEIKSISEKILNMPFLGDLVGRFVRVSDYGLSQKMEREKKGARSEDTRLRIDVRKAVNKELEGKDLTAKEQDLLATEKSRADRMRKTIKAYGSESLVSELETARSAGEKASVIRKFMEIDGKTEGVKRAAFDFVGQQAYTISDLKPEDDEKIAEWESDRSKALKNIKGLPADPIEAFAKHWIKSGKKYGDAYYKRLSKLREALKE